MRNRRKEIMHEQSFKFIGLFKVKELRIIAAIIGIKNPAAMNKMKLIDRIEKILFDREEPIKQSS